MNKYDKGVDIEGFRTFSWRDAAYAAALLAVSLTLVIGFVAFLTLAQIALGG